ncbi:MAG: tRNA preQ1(34) S-adenosylmethionine ribosyltransferase-isomerase QueA [Candidatus Binatia bacterium]
MDLGVLDYSLDPSLIAQQPLPTRDASRLLVVERDAGRWTHDVVQHLDEWLRPGDVLVANDAEVFAARLHGHRPTGGAIEVLLVEALDDDGTWHCIARGAGRIPVGEEITFGAGLRGTWGERLGDAYRAIRLSCDGDLSATLRAVGEVPLPPYIRRPDGPSPVDLERYQTMFARTPGAIAAPTAGLHFTPELIARLDARGISCVSLTLMVGPATFLPVRTESLDDHSVPPERYAISAETAGAIANARARGGRVVAVGTTTARALESVATSSGHIPPGAGRTSLVIAPGHQFRAVDALFTNFHLPRSSLLALVAAFAGTETILAAYRAATASSYRFYSYGDAMLIV